jgi:hypothetical protein
VFARALAHSDTIEAITSLIEPLAEAPLKADRDLNFTSDSFPIQATFRGVIDQSKFAA